MSSSYLCFALRQSPKLYRNVKKPDTGVVIHGLFIEAGRWDAQLGGLSDSLPGELVPRLPAVWVKPCTAVKVGRRYEVRVFLCVCVCLFSVYAQRSFPPRRTNHQAPLYKTQVRAGVLSTTGHSTNFVLTMYLPSKLPANFWILRGTALVTAVTE